MNQRKNNGIEWKKYLDNSALSWLKELNFLEDGKIIPYPLQIANVIRSIENEVVFIFDEVGMGKTITAAMIAKTYFGLDPSNKIIRIITNNSLIKGERDSKEKKGQFLTDWFEKIEFTDEEKKNITITNNHCSNIIEERVGLLIIDEAHNFVNFSNDNKEINRNRNLKKIKASKVVFLSATPFMHGINDLSKYIEYCWEILENKEKNESLEEFKEKYQYKLNNYSVNSFDVKSPFSKYFKETDEFLLNKYLKTFNIIKKTVKRSVPEVWTYDNDKMGEFVTKLVDSYKKYFEKCIIYVGRIEIGEELKKRVAERINNGRSNVCYISGKNSEDFQIHGRVDNIEAPDIIIANYHIANEGINLPNYDCVINYHIPAKYAYIEQRFGRIDRKNSQRSVPLKMIYWVKKEKWECDNYRRLMSASSMFIFGLLRKLPAKNSIITNDLLESMPELVTKIGNENKYKKILAEFEMNETKSNEEVCQKMKEYIAELKKQKTIILEDSTKQKSLVKDLCGKIFCSSNFFQPIKGIEAYTINVISIDDINEAVYKSAKNFLEEYYKEVVINGMFRTSIINKINEDMIKKLKSINNVEDANDYIININEETYINEIIDEWYNNCKNDYNKQIVNKEYIDAFKKELYIDKESRKSIKIVKLIGILEIIVDNLKNELNEKNTNLYGTIAKIIYREDFGFSKNIMSFCNFDVEIVNNISIEEKINLLLDSIIYSNSEIGKDIISFRKYLYGDFDNMYNGSRYIQVDCNKKLVEIFIENKGHLVEHLYNKENINLELKNQNLPEYLKFYLPFFRMIYDLNIEIIRNFENTKEYGDKFKLKNCKTKMEFCPITYGVLEIKKNYSKQSSCFKKWGEKYFNHMLDDIIKDKNGKKRFKKNTSKWFKLSIIKLWKEMPDFSLKKRNYGSSRDECYKISGYNYSVWLLYGLRDNFNKNQMRGIYQNFYGTSIVKKIREVDSSSLLNFLNKVFSEELNNIDLDLLQLFPTENELDFKY